MKDTEYQETEHPDRNEDAITGEPGSHPVGVGVGTTGGAAAGAAVGSIAGPVGTVVGAIAGGIAGAAGGKAVAEGVNPTEEDAYWRENHDRQGFADPEMDFERDYMPAYRMGYEGISRHRSTTWDEAEPKMESEWKQKRGESRLDWENAKHATRAGWHRVELALPGDADGDDR